MFLSSSWLLIMLNLVTTHFDAHCGHVVVLWGPTIFDKHVDTFIEYANLVM
jgi:hypothetical protein